MNFSVEEILEVVDLIADEVDACRRSGFVPLDFIINEFRNRYGTFNEEIFEFQIKKFDREGKLHAIYSEGVLYAIKLD